MLASPCTYSLKVIPLRLQVSPKARHGPMRERTGGETGAAKRGSRFTRLSPGRGTRAWAGGRCVHAALAGSAAVPSRRRSAGLRRGKAAGDGGHACRSREYPNKDLTQACPGTAGFRFDDYPKPVSDLTVVLGAKTVTGWNETDAVSLTDITLPAGP